MPMIKMLDKKSSLFHLGQAIKHGDVLEVVLTDECGEPIAKMVAINECPRRLGVARGRFVLPETFDADLPEAARLFRGTGS